MQNHLILHYREDEREMILYYQSEHIALTLCNPLAAGRLTKDTAATTERNKKDSIAETKYNATAEEDRAIIDRVASLAEKRG